MKVLTMGSPASTLIFNQEVNETYNGDYDVKTVREFYTLGHLLSNFENIQKFSKQFKKNKPFYNFLNWNFEKGGFWGKLKDFQPDLLVLDLFPEVYFGSLLLEDGTLVTRNFRLMKPMPHNATLFYTNYSDYAHRILKIVKLFRKKVREVSPKTELIFNGSRFPVHMSKKGIIQDHYDSSKFKLSQHDIHRYNNIWDSIDNALVDAGFNVTKFDQKNSAAELIFPNSKQWYYFYNQNYYTDVQSQVELFAQKYNFGPTITSINFKDDVCFDNLDQDVVFLNVPNSNNDLRIFRKNKTARKKALLLAKKDYILHGNKGSSYRFVKRSEIKTKFSKFKGVHYRVIPPKDTKTYGENKLLVRMFGFTFRHKTSVIQRNFQQDFKTLKDSLVKDTYILEIGDVNLIAGSFYTNTKNFPFFEEQIQQLIKSIAKEHNIKQDNIVLYGTSRGATGALLQAALGNYKFIVADPVINDEPWYVESDAHYIEGVRTMDLTDKINTALTFYHRPQSEGIILGSSNVGVTFSSHLRLPLDKLTLVDLNFSLYEHGLINSKSVPIQLSYINQLLIKDTVRIVSKESDLPAGIVIGIKPLVKNAINFEKINCFRLRLDDIKKRGKDDYDQVMKNIEGKYKYVRTDKEFEYFEAI